MYRFYWLLEGELAGCSRPGRDGALEDDLDWLRQQGIGAILSLTEDPLPAPMLAHLGFEVAHFSIPDMSAPLPEQFVQALDFIDAQRSAGRATAVHCLMGQGRTGSILAAYLIRDGTDATEAINQVRGLCPGAIQSESQIRALAAFAQRRDWIV